LLTSLVLVASTSLAQERAAGEVPGVLSSLQYEPPAPGSYDLPVIDTVTDHVVVDSAGEVRNLSSLKNGRLAIVAFVYTSCAEAEGCPLASAVLHRLDRQLAADPELKRNVRLISMSFDPQRDTPARMRHVREMTAPKTDWAFLTTGSEEDLQPILDDFGQSVWKLDWEDGGWSGLYRHVLKVFLVDEHNRIRNIYSSGFLHPQLVLNDVRTLLMESSNAERGMRNAE
jgi:cytochrome c peroxidase